MIKLKKQTLFSSFNSKKIIKKLSNNIYFKRLFSVLQKNYIIILFLFIFLWFILFFIPNLLALFFTSYLGFIILILIILITYRYYPFISLLISIIFIILYRFYHIIFSTHTSKNNLNKIMTK